MPRRPPHSLRSIMSNIHLLTGVPSFARWPLNLHFFSRDARKTWDSWVKSTQKSARAGLLIHEDFGPDTTTTTDKDEPWGVHALPLDYAPIKAHVQKAHDLVSFEREGKCVHCQEELESGKGLYPMCSTEGCEAMGHLTCWSDQALGKSDNGNILPNFCQCPSCGSEVRWGDMMKELSLRIRGSKEVNKLLSTKRKAKVT